MTDGVVDKMGGEMVAGVAAGEAFGREAGGESAEAADVRVALAEEVLGECRVSLMMAFRFMDAALWHMPLVNGEPARPPALTVPWEVGLPFAALSRPLMTDGAKLVFSSGRVLERYRSCRSEMTRDLLHAVLHCIFRHPFDSDHEDAAAWSLACDVVVEAVALEMCAERLSVEGDGDRRQLLDELRESVGVLTPFKLYRLFSSVEAGMLANVETGMSVELLHRLRAAFVRDAHDAWAVWRKEDEPRGTQAGEQQASEPVPDVQKLNEGAAGQGSGGASAKDDALAGDRDAAPAEPEDDDNVADGTTEGEGDDAETDDSVEGDPGDPGDDRDDPNDSSGSTDDDSARQREEERRAWEEIGKQMEADLGTYSQAWGSEAGSLVANLTVANRKPCNYADFLRRFCTLAEDMKVNDEEFDYIFYTLGLARYGNMPLVEPLEYQETNRVREFVVALDTSGSCSGDLIRNFVSRTYQILCESQQFGDEVNVHIVQCDNRIQSDTVITTVDELAKYRDSFWVKGNGGTDFRPVFDYVNQLMRKGEFTRLQGLIYFTDGLGTYPASPPPYDTAFVFVDDDGTSRRVPPWAMKVIIDEDRLREL